MSATDLLVSIVTPTMVGREKLLLERCLPSVDGQDWPIVEHVIVSDRNPGLAADVAALALPHIRFVQINDTWRTPVRAASTGALPWHIGSLMALGEYVGFVGDDDELLPQHISTHLAAMRDAGAVWSVSQVEFWAAGQPADVIIGDASYELGHLDSTGVMCHIDALRVANWHANGEDAADYRLVRDWRAAGLPGVFVPEVTGIHHDGWLVGRSGMP